MGILAPVAGRSFLEGPQKLAATALVGAGTVATAILAARTGLATPNGFTSFVVVGAQCALADIIATKIRHPSAALDWEFRGRGGHVLAVAAGLGLTFGPAAALVQGIADSIAVITTTSRENLGMFAKLWLGIEPWVAYDAMTSPAHEGKRGRVLVEESIKNAAGSTAATVFEPAVGALIASKLSRLGFIWKALSDQGTTVGGYLAVLTAGWQDFGKKGLSSAETARAEEK